MTNNISNPTAASIMTGSMSSQITAQSALLRGKSAPQIVVVAPSGSGKTTLTHLLANNRMIPLMKIGIGEKNQTTIIRCKFILDARIDERSFAVKIDRKDCALKEVHAKILSVLKELLVKHGFDAEEIMDALDDAFEQIMEPREASYHLGQMKDELPKEELKKSLAQILGYMADLDFDKKVKERRDELKSGKAKLKLAEVRELVFEEMFEETPEEIKEDYHQWLAHVGRVIERRLRDAIGDALFSGGVVRYSLDAGDDGKKVLSALLDPKAPYSLLIDHISVACRPREELIQMAREKYEGLPLRICIQDTMGMTQEGIGAKDVSDALETALNCKADVILFLMSLEERDDTQAECCKAVQEKIEGLKKKGLDIPVHVLYTKADRILENMIAKKNKDDLYISQKTYDANILAVIEELQAMVDEYSGMIPKEEVEWLSMRYLAESPILKALEDASLRRHFEPEGLFEKIVDCSMKTLQGMLPEGVTNPFFVTALDPDLPVVQVSVDPVKIGSIMKGMQRQLSMESSIVNEYVIPDKTPCLHGRSVECYWGKLQKGLGHTTWANVYGNFSINMKGLLRRMLTTYMGSFKTLQDHCAVALAADNLSDDELRKAVKFLTKNDDPALGDRNSALERLYGFYQDYFMTPTRFGLVVDRVAFDMSYGNDELKKKLHAIYCQTPGYDRAMRKLQYYFRDFFGNEDFRRILAEELGSVMTDMVNKAFLVI